jgi:hypothetical protein
VKHSDDAVDVQCLVLSCMSPELQKKFESTNPHDMIVRLKGMFENQARNLEGPVWIQACKRGTGDSSLDQYDWSC